MSLDIWPGDPLPQPRLSREEWREVRDTENAGDLVSKALRKLDAEVADQRELVRHLVRGTRK